MSYLKVGDVCVVVGDAHACEHCQRLNGTECTIVGPELLGIRRGCNGHETGVYFLVQIAGDAKPYALSRSELRKKDPPRQDDAEPRTEFTPAQPEFVEDLQRRLTKQTENA